MVVHTSILKTPEAEAGWSLWFQGPPGLHSKCQISQGYIVRLCNKNRKGFFLRWERNAISEVMDKENHLKQKLTQIKPSVNPALSLKSQQCWRNSVLSSHLIFKYKYSVFSLSYTRCLAFRQNSGDRKEASENNAM